MNEYADRVPATPEMRAVVAFMDSLPPHVLVELLRRAPESTDDEIAAWACCCHPGAAVLGPAHWEALRRVVSTRGIPGLEALAAVRGAWRRLVEAQGRAIVMTRVKSSTCERTRGLLRLPDLMWRINSAVRRLLHDTGALDETGAPDFILAVLQCLRAARTRDGYCGIWRDVYGALAAMEEFRPVRAQAFGFANALLLKRMRTGSPRVPGTPARA